MQSCQGLKFYSLNLTLRVQMILWTPVLGILELIRSERSISENGMEGPKENLDLNRKFETLDTTYEIRRLQVMKL